VVAQRSERNLTLLISQTIIIVAVADFSGGKTSDESLTARRVTPTAARASAFMFLRRGTIEDTDVNLSTVLCEETVQQREALAWLNSLHCLQAWLLEAWASNFISKIKERWLTCKIRQASTGRQ